MTKGSMPDEIGILRFFEDGPIEKAEVPFNIEREKMRERLSGREEGGSESVPHATPRRRGARPDADTTREASEQPKK
jgi:hypothetical protein